MDMVLTPRGLRFAGQMWPCTIGKGGIRHDKREGDGATPVGVHRITGMMYRPDRICAPTPWARPIRPGDLWSDASGQADYNHLVRVPYAHSHETLRRGDRLYDLVLLTDWNWPNSIAGKGSAIFLHRWRRPGFPTEGCVAFRPDHLLQISKRITPGSRLVVSRNLHNSWAAA
jgi:L,D-peptidoglycan transpeptidase YkuD (ErfK/YbiS/YcfS/YnhG family)